MGTRKIERIKFSSSQVPFFQTEDGGWLEADDHESTYQITQREIAHNVDITAATKHFDLSLPHLGPYKLDYFRNGRSLLIGGRNGHVAVLDWLTKDLKCEMNVRESVHAVQWLHMPTMYAVAQANYTYVYDEAGIEMHCLKRLYQAYELDFLPYHFLLVAALDNGWLSWLDTSTGQLVANYRMKKSPRIVSLTHNPANAITVTGHPNGTVRFWSPNVQESLVSLLCHPTSIRDVCFDSRGQVMISAGADRTVRLWDLRNYKCLSSFKLHNVPTKMDLSQRNMLAIGGGSVVEVYRIFDQGSRVEKVNDGYERVPYMRHRLYENSKTDVISDVKFVPFEDVLGLGHSGGMSSILVPGAGEANFDALEANPYMTKSQRREMEVKALLDKINHELITLDADFLGKVCNKNRAPNRYRQTMKQIEQQEKFRVQHTEVRLESADQGEQGQAYGRSDRPATNKKSFGQPAKKGRRKRQIGKFNKKPGVHKANTNTRQKFPKTK